MMKSMDKLYKSFFAIVEIYIRTLSHDILQGHMAPVLFFVHEASPT